MPVLHHRRERLARRVAELEAERALTLRLAQTDSLTGLVNRGAFTSALCERLDAARDARTTLALFVIDLDRFKHLNDTLGHHAGDLLLAEVGERLRADAAPGELVARLGGDEFVVLVTDSSAVREVDLLARLAARLEGLNGRGDREFQLAFSTGVAAFDPASPESLEDLLSEADSRMYLDKRRRKDAAAH